MVSTWLIFINLYHIVNIAIKQQQYCNTVPPQLKSDRFTQLMTSFTFNTRYEHFYNLKLLYSGYLSEILLYKRYSPQCP